MFNMFSQALCCLSGETSSSLVSVTRDTLPSVALCHVDGIGKVTPEIRVPGLVYLTLGAPVPHTVVLQGR